MLRMPEKDTTAQRWGFTILFDFKVRNMGIINIIFVVTLSHVTRKTCA